jgi:hypothetical protein
VRDAAPHASLTSPLLIPCSPPPCEPPRSVSRCVVPRISHAAAPCGRGELLPCAGRAVRGGAPPTAQPPAMPTGWSSPTGGRTIGRRHGPRSTPAASRRSTHGQGTANAKDLPPVFSGIFYVAIVVYRCCNSVLDMLQSVVFRM